MKYGLYTIRDRVAEVGGYPFVSRNNQTAARVYRDFMSKQNPATVDKNDFELMIIGVWDEEKCSVTAKEVPETIEVALSPLVNNSEA